MESLLAMSDAELLDRMPVLVGSERACTAAVIEHLIEIERRRLYLDQACSSLNAYCRERLRYSEDQAYQRVHVARFAARCPEVLAELASGAIHLTGLFLISQHGTEAEQRELLSEARGKSRRELERLIAARFPRSNVNDSITKRPDVGAETVSCRLETETGHLEPLSANTYRVEFTASAELHAKLERAKNLVSHSVPSGALPEVFERALDALIREQEKRLMGADKPRKARAPGEDSRHVPVAMAKRVRQRDGEQCTYVDELGRRRIERRLLTIEHRIPFAKGGLATLDNLCLLCKAHNHHTARQVFGEEHIERKRAERASSKERANLERANLNERASLNEGAVLAGLCSLGFRCKQAVTALNEVAQRVCEPSDERELLRQALQWRTSAVPAR